MKSIFDDNIKGPIQRTPVQDYELRYDDSAVVSLMLSALVMAFASEANLASDNKRIIWEPKGRKEQLESGQQVNIFNAVELSLRFMGNHQYLTLLPTLRIEGIDGSEVETSTVQAIRFRELGTQYNSQFNDAVNRWRELLFTRGGKQKEIEFPPNSGSGFKFRIRRSPIFAEIGRPGHGTSLNLDSVPLPLRRHKGFEISEPPLIFGRSSGSGFSSDTHPLRGILSNRPYDFSLTQSGLDQSVRLGVICPAQEEQRFFEYLLLATHSHRVRSHPEYILDFPGFQQAFGLPLNIPSPSMPEWVSCPEPTSPTAEMGAPELGQLLINAVKQLRATAAPDVIVIYIPGRWGTYRGFRNESERFDLHDFVKAFCVQKGIATQFLEEKTLRELDQCRVFWWLSLALYVKSMRTPWVLKSLDEEAAFVGIGFSVDPTKQRGRHVVLGCSHIYSATGEGLQYRLTQIEQPIWFGRNPFMSEDDARRLGETIRQLFFDSRSKLPHRVVLHKQTPFRKEEREGLAQGLAGVKEIEYARSRDG